MGITFRCEHCRKEVEAPDAAAGKRGKCPFCRKSNYIPAPVSEEDVLPLAPVDEQEERRRAEKVQKLLEEEKELLEEQRGEAAPPLEQREDLASEELHHFVVNYCLDMANSKLERAGVHVKRLKEFGGLGVEAVDDFIDGNAAEPALEAIPPKVLQGFLSELKSQVSSR
jgi:phage FluMu protein Com